MRRVLSLVGCLVALLATVAVLAGPAGAHSSGLLGAPGPGDVVPPGVDLVQLEFPGVDDDGAAGISVLDPQGKPVKVGTTTFATDSAMCATVAPLRAGVHTIEYEVTADDGHRMTGRYEFEVADRGEEPLTPLCDKVDLPAPSRALRLSDVTVGDRPATWKVLGAVAVPLVLIGAIAGGVQLRRRARTREVSGR